MKAQAIRHSKERDLELLVVFVFYISLLNSSLHTKSWTRLSFTGLLLVFVLLMDCGLTIALEGPLHSFCLHHTVDSERQHIVLMAEHKGRSFCSSDLECRRCFQGI